MFAGSDVVYNMGKLRSRFANIYKHFPPPHFLAGVHFSLFEVFFCCPEKKIRLQLFAETGSVTFPPYPCSSSKSWICSLGLLRCAERARGGGAGQDQQRIAAGQRYGAECTDSGAKRRYDEPPF